MRVRCCTIQRLFSRLKYLALHGIRIDLTHVGSFVTALHVSHHQLLTGDDNWRKKEEDSIIICNSISLTHCSAYSFHHLPSGVTEMAHRYARVVRYHVSMNSLNGFAVRFDPSDFVTAEMSDVTSENSLRSQCHRLIWHQALKFG